METKKLIQSSLFIALITVGANLKIPIGIVPITLQLMVVLLMGFLLKPKHCLITVSAYIILGILGLPLFSGGGGPAYLVSPTFGYLLGFLFCSWAISLMENKAHPLIRLIIGYLIIYACGLSYAYILKNFILKNTLEFSTLFMSYWFVFLPSDVFSILVVLFGHKAVQRAFK